MEVWADRNYRVLLRPCQARWPHELLMTLTVEDLIDVECVNCRVAAYRLRVAQAERVFDQNQQRIAAIRAVREAGSPTGPVKPCAHG